MSDHAPAHPEANADPDVFEHLPVKLTFLGRITETEAVKASTSFQRRLNGLTRHFGGRWGLVGTQTRAHNDHVLTSGGCLLSACPIDPKAPRRGTFLIGTEAEPRPDPLSAAARVRTGDRR